jgi:hypothetical protein
MASSCSVEKRQAWEARFRRYCSSGLSVAKFCEQERVSVNTFYYWASRLKSPTTRIASPRQPSQSSDRSAASTADSNPPVATVRFRGKTGTEVWVPADCLEAIRCLAKCLMLPGEWHGEMFQEVVVKA